MTSEKWIKIFSPVLFLSLLLSANGFASQGATCQMSTLPKIVTYQPDWFGNPKTFSSSETVVPGGTLELYVNSGGFGCSPYTWEVTGTGYTLDKSKSVDLEVVTIESQGGT
ncbi:MAG: hypothetical protein ABII06_00625 [Pseudomonadota bacterium]